MKRLLGHSRVLSALLCLCAIGFGIAQISAPRLGGQELPGPEDSTETEEQAVTVPVSELLMSAKLKRAAGNASEAVALLREIVSRGQEDHSIAAQAQWELGDCLLMDLNRTDEAESELLKVVSEFTELSELVNSARVRLCHVYLSRREYEAVDAVAKTVLADGSIDGCGKALVAWAVLAQGQMHEAMSIEAELAERPGVVLQQRTFAAMKYAEALQWGGDAGVEREITKRMVNEICHRHRYYMTEYELHPQWIADNKLSLARMLTESSQTVSVEDEEANRRAESIAHLRRLARDAEQREDFEEAIVWYRVAIPDVSDWNMNEQCIARIAQLFRQRGDLLGEYQWRLYCTDPVVNHDPTAQLVLASFGITVSVPSGDALEAVSARFLALGRTQIEHGRFKDAIDTFQLADAAAEGSWDHGRALSGLGEACGRWVTTQKHHTGGRDQRMVDLGLKAARDAVEHWIAVACTDSNANGPEPAAGILMGFHYLSDQEGVAALELLINRLEGSAPIRKAFAEYMRMLAVAWCGQYGEAIRAGVDLEARYSGSEDLETQRLCALSLTTAAAICSLDGDRSRGLTLLNTVQAKYPGAVDDQVNIYRDGLEGSR